jgi:hypothetical protein
VPEETDGVRLADFLAGLRAELALAQERATGPLKLGVEEITLTVDVKYGTESSQRAGASVKATFWAVLSGEASVQADRSASRSRTHTLTLTLKPRMEEETLGADGQRRTIKSGVDIEGRLDADEENPPLGPAAAARPETGQPDR